MRLQGKVALVTGGGSGIGEAICQAMASEGAHVGVLDVNGDAAKLVAGTLGAGAHHAVAADVSDSAAVDAAVAEVEDALGPLDVLVNNAGIAPKDQIDRNMPKVEAQLAEAAEGRVRTPLEATVQLADHEWRQMLAVHLDGTFYCTRAALRTMAPRGAGAIVNVASICGLQGCAGFAHYSAAKAGILGFTRAVAKEVILQGVRVNAIAPGYIATPMTDQMSEAARAAIAVSTPAQAFGRPQDIATTAVFLASDEAAFYVGATLSPNGGYVTAV